MLHLAKFIRVGPVAAAALAIHLSGCHDDNVYHLGGTVAGLTAGDEVTLLNNGADATTVAANGTFTFPTKVASYSRYNVTIGTQPAGQICVVAQSTSSGTVTADVTGVAVSCDSWTKTSAPAVKPSAITISADATYVAVAENGGGILVSTDGGATWTRTRAPTGTWVAITSSADGARLAAAMSPGGIIYTSNDAGATWSKSSAPGASWTSLAFSGDGTHVVASNADHVIDSTTQAISFVGTIYVSADAGVTWSKSNGPCCDWAQVAASADGTRFAAVTTGGSAPGVSPPVFSPNGIYTFNSASPIWVLQSGAETPSATPPASACNGVCVWNSIAGSTDGLTLVASRNAQPIGSPVFGSITLTQDGGASWKLSGAPTNVNWWSVASSADGKRLAAAGTGGVYLSSDAGTTWNKTSAPATIATVVSSADGKHLAAIDNGQTIWVGVSF